MGAVLQILPKPFLPIIHRPNNRGAEPRTITAKAQPSCQGSSSSASRQLRNQEVDEGTTSQLRGSDVLWAMRRAASEKQRAKRNNNSKKKVLPGLSKGGQREASKEEDYSDARPLCIKSDWRVRMDDLGKRLANLSQTK